MLRRSKALDNLPLKRGAGLKLIQIDPCASQNWPEEIKSVPIDPQLNQLALLVLGGVRSYRWLVAIRSIPQSCGCQEKSSSVAKRYKLLILPPLR